jgi:hypothetical protein
MADGGRASPLVLGLEGRLPAATANALRELGHKVNCQGRAAVMRPHPFSSTFEKVHRKFLQLQITGKK